MENDVVQVEGEREVSTEVSAEAAAENPVQVPAVPAVAAAANGGHSELETRASRAEQLTAQLQGELHRYRVLELARDEALRLGIHFESGALADAYALGLFKEVQSGDGGVLAGMEAALTALKQDRPYLLKARQRDKPAVPDIDALARGAKGNPLENTAARAAARGLMRGF